MQSQRQQIIPKIPHYKLKFPNITSDAKIQYHNNEFYSTKTHDHTEGGTQTSSEQNKKKSPTQLAFLA